LLHYSLKKNTETPILNKNFRCFLFDFTLNNEKKN
jgi:hypothetical protein